MPYIEKYNKDKFSLDILLGNIEFNGITPGELNYLLTSLCKAYIDHKGINYTHLNDVVGVLECCKQEFYRRILVDYEDLKKEKNGDVY